MPERSPEPPHLPPWPRGLDLPALPSLSDEARAAMNMAQSAFQTFTSWAESVLGSPDPSDEAFGRVAALMAPFEALARRLFGALAAQAYGEGAEAEVLQAAAELESFVWSYVPA